MTLQRPTIRSQQMYYLAYGSNMHPLRLSLRVPNACLVGTTELEGRRLTFHKRSTDGSAKCNLQATGDPGDVAFGVVFETPAEQVALLDAAEGLGNGYYKAEWEVRVGDAPISVFVYLASRSHISSELQPYHWYKGFVAAGARRHRFPGSYLQQIAGVPSKPDPNKNRRIEMENLLVQLEA